MAIACLGSVISGACTGQIQRWEGKQGSDLRAVGWNHLEKFLLTHLVVGDDHTWGYWPEGSPGLHHSTSVSWESDFLRGSSGLQSTVS